MAPVLRGPGGPRAPAGDGGASDLTEAVLQCAQPRSVSPAGLTAQPLPWDGSEQQAKSTYEDGLVALGEPGARAVSA